MRASGLQMCIQASYQYVQAMCVGHVGHMCRGGCRAVAVWPGGGGGGQLPLPSGPKNRGTKIQRGAKLTAEVCMMSYSKVSVECTA